MSWICNNCSTQPNFDSTPMSCHYVACSQALAELLTPHDESTMSSHMKAYWVCSHIVPRLVLSRGPKGVIAGKVDDLESGAS